MKRSETPHISGFRVVRCCQVAAFFAAACSIWATEVHFSERRIIDASAGGLWSLASADLDGDGDTDLLAGADSAQEVVWWENQGGQLPDWTKHSVGGGLRAPHSVFAADLDGDTHVDILSAHCDTDTIAWWQNDGGRFPNWTRRDVSTSVDCAVRVVAADLDGDGDMDVLGTSDTGAGGAADIAWWENDGSHPPAWIHHPIEEGLGGANSAFAIDIDGDGDTDVVGTAPDTWSLESGAGPGQVAWWENDGSQPPRWTKHLVDGSFNHAVAAWAADFNLDGDTDVLAIAVESPERIAWWENDGGEPPGWTKRGVDESFGTSFSVFAEDVDGDGDLDILGPDGNANAVVWWDNDGQDPPGWTKRTIDAESVSWVVLAVDVDGDGDRDPVAAGFRGDSLVWWANDHAEPTLTSVSSASYLPPNVAAPGMIAAGFGPGLARATAFTTSLDLSAELLGTWVDITDGMGVTRRAPLFYVSPAQISYLVPAETAIGPATVLLHSGAGTDIPGTLQVESVAPGIYTANQQGTRFAAAFFVYVGADGTQLSYPFVDPSTSSPIPVDLGSEGDQVYLVIYGTGLRGMSQELSATVGGEYVPAMGPFVHSVYQGLDQVNLGPLPRSLVGRWAEMDIVLTVDGKQANTVTVLMK